MLITNALYDKKLIMSLFLLGLFSCFSLPKSYGKTFGNSTSCSATLGKVSMNGEKNKVSVDGAPIPIHFYFIHNDNGYPSPSVTPMTTQLEILNTALGGSTTFFRCAQDHFVDKDFYFFTPLEADALYDAHHDDNALNVYVVGLVNNYAPGFFTYYPNDPARKNMIVIAPSLQSLPHYLAYIVGKHCGLLETTLGIGSGSCPPDPANPTAGDLLADTPVDPGPTLCPCGEDPCIVECVDVNQTPHTYTYHPNYTNIMAFPRLCATSISQFNFSPQQKSIIQNFSENTLNFTPSGCQTEFIPDFANLERYCISTDWEGVANVPILITNYSFGTAPPPGPVTAEDPYAGVFRLGADIHTPNDNILMAPLKNRDASMGGNAAILAPLFGVTGYDLVLISKHILAIDPFTYASQFFAADVNYSGSITTFDIVSIRKVILGIDLTFPNQTGSWRYVPRYYMLSDPDFAFQVFEPINPFAAKWMMGTSNERVYASGINSFMDILPIDLTGNPFVSDPKTFSFWAIKTGDVNCETLPLLEEGGEEELYDFTYPTGGTTILNGQSFDISIKVSSGTPLVAYQLGINFDPSKIEILSPQPGTLSDYNTENFGLTHLAEGKLRTLWFKEDGAPSTFGTNTTAFKLRCRALQPISNLESVLHVEEESEFDSGFFNTGGIEVPAQITLAASSLLGLASGGSDVDVLFYPGVFKNKVNLQASAKKEGNIKVRLFDFLGHSQWYTFELTEGLNDLPLEVPSSMQPGIIYYQVEQNGLVTSGKLIKQQSK